MGSLQTTIAIIYLIGVIASVLIGFGSTYEDEDLHSNVRTLRKREYWLERWFFILLFAIFWPIMVPMKLLERNAS